MYALYTKVDRRLLGEIGDDDMQFLRDNLEEESLTDVDYTLTRMTVEYLRENGMSPRLAQVLEAALGDQDEVEIVYEQKES